jgi:5'-nucleotidase
MSRQRILVTNDDGISAAGLSALADKLSVNHQVHVVAPDRNRSGASSALTLQRPLRLNRFPDGAISIDGTPTDCVHIAITDLYQGDLDIVVSGINHGANMGDDVWYSGTVGAAMEGRFLGAPAIAISLVGGGDSHFDTAARVAAYLLEQLISSPLQSHLILNVNVPNLPWSDLAGFEITRLGTRACPKPAIRRYDPRGQEIYWIGKAGDEQDDGQGTDFHAVASGRVSITPLRIDLTHYESFANLLPWAERLGKAGSV